MSPASSRPVPLLSCGVTASNSLEHNPSAQSAARHCSRTLPCSTGTILVHCTGCGITPGLAQVCLEHNCSVWHAIAVARVSCVSTWASCSLCQSSITLCLCACHTCHNPCRLVWPATVSSPTRSCVMSFHCTSTRARLCKQGRRGFFRRVGLVLLPLHPVAAGP